MDKKTSVIVLAAAIAAEVFLPHRHDATAPPPHIEPEIKASVPSTLPLNSLGGDAVSTESLGQFRWNTFYRFPTAKTASLLPFTVWAFVAGPKANRRNRQIEPNANLYLMCAPFRIYSCPFVSSFCPVAACTAVSRGGLWRRAPVTLLTHLLRPC